MGDLDRADGPRRDDATPPRWFALLVQWVLTASVAAVFHWLTRHEVDWVDCIVLASISVVVTALFGPRTRR